MNSRRPATGSFRIQPVPGSTPITRIINFTVAPRCSAALSGISALPADAIRSGVQSMRYRCKFRGLTESEAVNGQGCSTKPAIYFAQHQETRQTCSPTEDKRSLLSYFSIVFSRSLSHARIHTHTHTHSVSFSLPFSPIIPLCFHYPFSSVSIIPLLFRHFRNLFLLFLISQCLFRTTILFTESLSFYSPRHRFRLFAASVFPSSPLRSSVSFPRSFALLRCLV